MNLDKELSEQDFLTFDIGRFTDADNASTAGPNAGELETAFFDHKGRAVHKWHHYLPLYDRYLKPYRDRDRAIRLLEIGVSKGGSLELWRGYFGPSATIYGIDIDPSCAAFDGEGGNRIRIGSQDDPAFLGQVIAEMGGVDIVLDDGSHLASHQRASFDVLFPLLEDGGLYVVEDLHAAYWTYFEGGYASTDSFIARCKTLIDDMHHWYHPRGEKIAAARGHVSGLHIHDSIAFIDKHHVSQPVTSIRGVVTPVGQ